MDILVLIFGAILALVGAGVGGFVAGMVYYGYGYANLDSRLNAMSNKLASGAGIQARQDKAERMSLAMADAMLVFKDESIPKEEKTKAMLGLAGKYPDVALDLVKQIGLKGLL